MGRKVYAPLSGTVEAVNEELEETPELINESLTKRDGFSDEACEAERRTRPPHKGRGPHGFYSNRD